MTLEKLSSVYAKLEPPNSKYNEILELNVLQKFTVHALFRQSFELFRGEFSKKVTAFRQNTVLQHSIKAMVIIFLYSMGPIFGEAEEEDK